MNARNSLIFQTDLEAFSVAFSKKELSKHIGLDNLKYYLVVCYLRRNVTWFGEIRLTINDLISGCGYSTTSKNGSIAKQFKVIIKELLTNEYIETEYDIDKVKPNEFFKIRLNAQKNLYAAKAPFILISIKEFDTIINNESETSKAALFAVYLILKQHIFGDKCRIAYPSKKNISTTLGISTGTVENAINDLLALKMIYKRDQLYMEDQTNPGYYIPTRNVYAIEEYYLYSDQCIEELSNFYNIPVYTKEEIVSEKIHYIKRHGNKDSPED